MKLENINSKHSAFNTQHVDFENFTQSQKDTAQVKNISSTSDQLFNITPSEAYYKAQRLVDKAGGLDRLNALQRRSLKKLKSVIFTDASLTLQFVYNIQKAPYPKNSVAEKIIFTDSNSAVNYAQHVLGKPYEEDSPALKTIFENSNPDYADFDAGFYISLFPKALELDIAYKWAMKKPENARVFAVLSKKHFSAGSKG